MSNDTKTLLESTEHGFHASTLSMKELFHRTWSYGLLSVEVEVGAGDIIHYTVTLAGLKIGEGSLNSSNATATVGANTPVSKASATLKLDFGKRELWISGTVGINILFKGWEIHEFNSKILSF